MARQIRNGLGLKQEEKGKNTPLTRLFSTIRNVFTANASKSGTTIPAHIIAESPRELRGKPSLERATMAAESLLRRALALQ
jgi:hypothetical protein